MKSEEAGMRTLLGGTSVLRTLLVYGAMIAATIGLFFLIKDHGAGLTAPRVENASKLVLSSKHASTLWHVLLALATIVIAARGGGWLFERKLGQPAVMGEIVAGLLLGPSALGAISPTAYAFLLPPEAAPLLGVVAKIGVVLFMFLVGLELDTRLLKGSSHATLAISHASIVVPFILGSSLAIWLYPRYSHDGVPFTSFALFVGVSLSVTAFPVLARILTDRRVQGTPLGATALACAAVDDVTAWCLLAFVSGVATAHVEGAYLTIGLVVVYVAFMFLVARPLAQWFAQREQKRTVTTITSMAMVFSGVLLSAAATEALGIHALFGAFLAGVMMPHEGRLAEGLRARLEDIVVVLMLPVFFAFTGMRTQIGLMSGAADWIACAVIIGAATVGKFGGTLVAARLSRLGWRESAALGILMNTRGLMELIVLNVGLDMGVLSPTLFAMMVLMALVTTLATTPIFNAVSRGVQTLRPPPAAIPAATERA